MLDVVILRFEDGGRPLPRHRLAFPQTAYEGRFSFKESWCPELRRHVMMAQLSTAVGADVLPPLYDARLVYYDGGEARVAGLDLDTLSSKFTAQTWAVKIAALSQQ
jgi:acyl carrier protein phosphodiesterase